MTEQISGRPVGALHSLRIKSVVDNTFYKVKVERWRGAVWVDSSGRPWLCAVGVRRDGDPDDFYKRFATSSKQGSDRYLPGPGDANRLRADQARAADDVHLRLLRARVVAAFLKAADEGSVVSVALPVTISAGSLQPVDGATLTVGVCRVTRSPMGS